jgi:hypothetical protein
MKRMLAIVLVLSACAGGATEAVWLRPGAPAYETDQVRLTCLREAEAAFPVRRSIVTTPRVTIGVGSRHDVRGGVGTEFSNFDRNEERRDVALGACMGRQGYALTTLPRCAGATSALQSQPFDVRGLCATGGRVAAPL